MADIEATDPEDNIFGDVSGVIGDALEMARGKNELQARTHESRLSGQPEGRVKGRLRRKSLLPLQLEWRYAATP